MKGMSDDEYRAMAYESNEDVVPSAETTTRNSLRRFSHRVSREFDRRRSSVVEQLPQTPQGWVFLLSAIAAAVTAYEIRLQTSLTAEPVVFGQVDAGPLQDIYRKLIEHEKAILRRKLRPSLFIGTRGVMSSVASFLLGGPSATDRHLRFREILKSSQDGATFAIDWELPPVDDTTTVVSSNEERIEICRKGRIDLPVIVILHGLNNDASFGYIKSLMRTCTDRGWIAVGVNLRGCGGVSMTTPRGYNGAYTGDLRFLVHTLSSRLNNHVPIFLVGNSLGANLVAKYLGEEGLSGTLPKAVIGGVTLGNPMGMNSANISNLWSPLMALGAKKTLLMNWMQLRKMTDPNFQRTIRKALMAPTLRAFDDIMAPLFASNDNVYPFSFRPGFENGQGYWDDASSYRLTRHVSVPLMQVIAVDDFLVYAPFRHRLSYSVSNPNVLVVETKVGGHLGWQQAPKDGNFLGATSSWADEVTADFIDAVIKDYREKINNGTYRRWSEGNSIFGDEKHAFRSRL